MHFITHKFFDYFVRICNKAALETFYSRNPDKTTIMKRILARIGVMLCSFALVATSFAADPPTDSKSSCYILKKDGSVVSFKTLKLVTGMFTTPHLLADGKTKITGDSIMAYQDLERYAISQDFIKDCRKSKVAVDALPGFAVRIAKGNLNVYCKKYFNGAKAVEEYFIQAGETGKIVPYNLAMMEELVKDQKEIKEILDSKDKTLAEKLQVIAEAYNSQQSITKN